MNQIFESLTWTVWSTTILAKIDLIDFPFGFHLNCSLYLSLESSIGWLSILQTLAGIGFSNKMPLNKKEPGMEAATKVWGASVKINGRKQTFQCFSLPSPALLGGEVHHTPSLQGVPALCFHQHKTNYSWLFICLCSGWKAYQALSVLNSEQNIWYGCTVRFSFIHIIAVCFVHVKLFYDFCLLTRLSLGYAILKIYSFYNSTKQQLFKKEK